MKLNLKLYLLLSLFWFILTSEEIKFSHLTVKDGLSQSSVKCLFQDSKGYLWIGTADGLNKFDGYQFEIFNSSPIDPNSLSGNDITCVYENPNDGTLWVGTQNAGLNIYNREYNNFYPFWPNREGDDFSPPLYITDILSTGQTTWFATKQQGICFFNPTDSTFIYPAFSKLPTFKTINCFEEDKNGSLWLGTPSGLYQWRYANKLNHNIPEKIELPGNQNDKIITAIKTDIKGNLWIGTQNNGLFKFHPKSKERSHFLPEESENSIANIHINDILERQNGEIWIATQAGISKYLPDTKNFQTYQHNSSNQKSLNNNTVYSLLEDKSGIIWVGTYSGGLNIFDPMESRFPNFNNFPKLKGGSILNNKILSITVDNSGTVWLGTSGGLIEIKRQGTLSKISDSNSKIHLAGNQVGAVVSTEVGIIFSSPIGIQLKTKNNKYISLTPLILKQTNQKILRFSSAIVDEYKQVWLTTVKGLLKYIPDLNKFELYRPTESLSGGTSFIPLAISEDQTGKIWVGTFSGNLFSFDKYSNIFEKVLTPDITDDLRGFSKIFSLCTAVPNKIWLGTNLGLYSFSPLSKKIERFITSDGLANNVVYSAIADKNGNIWCSTNLGVSMLNVKTKKFQNYTYQDGLQSNEFNQGAHFRGEDGTIYLGGIEGLNIFDPEKIAPNSFIPNVVITKMEINYKNVSPTTHPNVTKKHISESSKLKLTYKQNTFSFEFTALSYSLPSRNKYKYALTQNGQEDQWIEAGIGRNATFTNIAPGEYTFKVKGSNSDGIFNDVPTSIELTIKPPYWQTWPFKIALFVFILGLIYLIVYYRIRTISRQKIILKKLVQEKTEELLIQTQRIETQNIELKKTNENVLKSSLKIEQKNKLLNKQHNQLLKQRDDLLRLAEKVENTNQTKLRFFTSVSHELRTPLTLILNPLKDLLQNIEQQSKTETKRKLKNIHNNASKLLLIVNQLLDFRKAETAHFELKISYFEFAPFIQKCAFLFNDLASQRNIDFKFSSDIMHLKIWADKDLLEKTMYNLLSNAFQATHVGGSISIHVSKTVEENNDFVVLTLKDNGKGIDPDKIQFIFKRFHQIDDSSDLHHSGSGLGLALVKRYIDLHHGIIKVKSSLGNGTEFEIKLRTGKIHFGDKIQYADQTTNNQDFLVSSIGNYLSVDSGSTESENSKGKFKVLLIEDDTNLRAYVSEMLAGNYNVLEADTALNGYRIAETKSPDLIISDVMFSDIDGFELCKKLKAQFKTSHIPVILLTSLADKENHMNGIKAGADAYITKPFDLQHLILTIENLIEGRQKLQKRFNLSYSNNDNEDLLNSTDRIFVNKAMTFVEENITDSSFNVEQLCSKLNISQPQCYRKIKAITGLNISEFIRNTRLKKAAILLKQGNCKISEAAYQSGFNDPNYFTKSFTKMYGMTPREYAKSFFTSL